MKIINLTALFIIITLTGCLQNSKKDKSSNAKKDCERFVHFGDIDICLPKLEGMKECALNPLMKNKVNLVQSIDAKVLGFYVNDSTYKHIDIIDQISFDDYCYIYAANVSKGMKIGSAELDETMRILTKSSYRENWGKMKKRIEEKMKQFTFGKPVLLDEYSSGEKIRTAILLMKIQAAEEDYILVTALNVMEVKERMICLVYYREYDGETSIKKTKSTNDYLALRLIDENK